MDDAAVGAKDRLSSWVEAVNIAQARAEAAEAQRDDLLVAVDRLLMTRSNSPDLASLPETELRKVVASIRTAMNDAAKKAFDAANAVRPWNEVAP